VIAQTRPHNNNFVVPALGLAILLAFVVALPGVGQVDVMPSPHVTQHNVGTLPSSVINENIMRGNCKWFYSSLYKQHLALVQIDGMCGGAVFRIDAYGRRVTVEPTAFGGSECVSGDSCGYWWCCIQRGKYLPVASVGG
jgi:hypothetical protein